MSLSPKQKQYAELIFQMGRGAGLPANRALELVAAAYAESGLQPTIRNAKSGAAGLFQLLSPGYVNRANAQGGVDNPQANVNAILPDYVKYWQQHPGAAPGAGGAAVERSGQGAGFYASPLASLAGVGGAPGQSAPSAATGGTPIMPDGMDAIKEQIGQGLIQSSMNLQRGEDANLGGLIHPLLEQAHEIANEQPQQSLPPMPGPEGPAPEGGSKKVDSRLVGLAHSFGLRITSGYRTPEQNQATGGAEKSWHLQGKAIDVSPTNAGKTFFQYALANPQLFAEVFYDPMGVFIKDGKIYHGAIGGHEDHIHIAIK